jgi:uncharacterized membrane protein YsdA (DUF1294 family)
MSRRHRSPQRAWLVPAVLAAAVAGLVLWVWLDLHPYVAWLAGASLALFLLYGIDKQRARQRGGRVPEVVLHGIALAGGFAGGWAGRALFRHKTRKAVFLLVLALATILHAGVILAVYR